MCACGLDMNEYARSLSKKKSSLDRGSSSNMSMIARSDLSRLRMLLSQGHLKPDAVRDKNGTSVLGLTAYYGKEEALCELIRFGANPVDENLDHTSCLSMAIFGDQPVSLALLLASLPREEAIQTNHANDAANNDDNCNRDKVFEARNDAASHAHRTRMVQLIDSWLEGKNNDPILCEARERINPALLDRKTLISNQKPKSTECADELSKQVSSCSKRHSERRSTHNNTASGAHFFGKPEDTVDDSIVFEDVEEMWNIIEQLSKRLEAIEKRLEQESNRLKTAELATSIAKARLQEAEQRFKTIYDTTKHTIQFQNTRIQELERSVAQVSKEANNHTASKASLIRRLRPTLSRANDRHTNSTNSDAELSGYAESDSSRTTISSSIFSRFTSTSTSAHITPKTQIASTPSNTHV